MRTVRTEVYIIYNGRDKNCEKHIGMKYNGQKDHQEVDIEVVSRNILALALEARYFRGGM